MTKFEINPKLRTTDITGPFLRIFPVFNFELLSDFDVRHSNFRQPVPWISDLIRILSFVIRTLRPTGRLPLRCYRNFRLFICLAATLPCAPAWAHIGSPNIFFEGNAGPYAVHVVVQPAEVIPGLAEISVRVESGAVQRVTALPIKWNAGRKGAPPPDVARLVPGETNLYSAQLWFMEGGAQSIEIELSGSSGTGRVTIPVDAVARRVLGVPKALGGIL